MYVKVFPHGKGGGHAPTHYLVRMDYPGRKECPPQVLRGNVALTRKLIESKASAQGQTVTDFLRQRALDYRLRQSPLEKERIRQLARIGANMNQIARWANTYKKRAEAVEVITRLIVLERKLHEEENEPCT